MLEATQHDECSFLTLTYDDKNLPEGGTLVPGHYQKFLKDLRWRLSEDRMRLRYAFVGEYGEISQRPHYHAALFGIGCDKQALVQETWGRGFTYLGTLTKESAQYIAGYTVKKMTNKNDPEVLKWLNGRHPEFFRPSLKPGLGANAMDELAKTLSDNCDIIDREGDVPNQLRHGQTKLPLGRYLRRKLREKMGFKNTGCPPEKQKEMFQLFAANFKNAETAKKYLEKQNQRILNIETKAKIYSKKGDL